MSLGNLKRCGSVRIRRQFAHCILVPEVQICVANMVFVKWVHGVSCFSFRNASTDCDIALTWGICVWIGSVELYH